MTAFQFILIFAVIGYCVVNPEEVDCQELFDTEMKGKCLEINNPGCSFFKEESYHCVETNDCSQGNGNDGAKCRKINPSNFHKQKCDLDGTTCKTMDKKCSEWKMNDITEIDCTGLTPSSNNEICRLVSGYYPYQTVLDSGTDSSGTSCISYHKSCSTIDDSETCNKNIPDVLNYKCEWDSTKSPKCQSKEIYCGSNTYYKGARICRELFMTDADKNAGKKCIFYQNSCQIEYSKCEDRPYVTEKEKCEDFMPLSSNNVEYDYSMKCIYNPDAIIPSGETGYKCKSAKRKCTEYNFPSMTTISGFQMPDGLLNEAFCSQLEVTDNSYQRCAYDETNGCYEEYKTCEDYILHKIETTRDCEKIVLTNPNQKCVYDEKEDTCVTIEKYAKCSDYHGKDKKTCESILSSDTHQYCILDKDTECIEKPINCSEAYTEDDCIKIAKPSDSNKRCAYKGSKCVEEYIRCEDYLGETSNYQISTSTCQDIQLYDGKTCDWVSTNTATGSTTYMCRSQFKTCGQASTKEECLLIAKTGVTDPERKVCSWTGSDCIENYKYCSDYRGLDDSNSLCTRIKPYDESGNNIDIGSKCIYDVAGCQRVPVECSDAGTNPILCEAYSDYIKDKDKKYCFFDVSNCKAHYKKCEDFEPHDDITSCSSNIIKGFTTKVCDDDNGKCVQKYDCSKFSTVNTYKSLICKSIHPNCTYTYPNKCEYSGNNKCDDIKFYSNNSNYKETCENMEASVPYKKCVLKEDQSGCEEVYREYNYSTGNVSYSTTPDASNQGNSSGFIMEGIHLIMALLCLLI